MCVSCGNLKGDNIVIGNTFFGKCLSSRFADFLYKVACNTDVVDGSDYNNIVNTVVVFICTCGKNCKVYSLVIVNLIGGRGEISAEVVALVKAHTVIVLLTCGIESPLNGDNAV